MWLSLDNQHIAAGYFAQAEARLKTARSALRGENFAYAIRQSQEAVELGLKAALLYAAIDVPKVHDVGPFLLVQKGRFPLGFRRAIPWMVQTSRRLRSERERSMYGDEAIGLPADKLYTRADAVEATKDAAYVVRTVRRLLSD